MNAATEDADALDLDADEVARARLGQVVAGTYRLARHLGSGSSGHVFEAEHLRLSTPFAVKLLRSDLAGRRAGQRFRREAKAVARLRNEHVVRVFDCGELEDRTPYLVMELLEGEDLRRLLGREGRLPARRAIQLVLEASRGLTEAHQQGLVHRDLKPENLFVTRRTTGEDWCKVLDFGVAKMDASLSTAQGAIVGTVRYMAPEQLTDGASVGPATDVYALGAILYECLSGQKLHAGETIHEVMFSVMNRAPTSLATLQPHLPRSLVELIERCTAPKVSDRPQRAAELARLLETVLESAETSADRADVTLADIQQAPQPLHGPSPPKAPTRSIVLAATLAAVAGGVAAWLAKPMVLNAPLALSAKHPGAAPLPTLASAVPDEAPDGTAISITANTAPLAPSQTSTSPTPRSPAPRRPVRPSSVSSAARENPAGQGVPVGAFDSANPYGE
jgi:serine/threonine-protein kinase